MTSNHCWIPLLTQENNHAPATVLHFARLFPTVGVWQAPLNASTALSIDDYYVHEQALQRLLSGAARSHQWHDTDAAKDAYYSVDNITRPLYVTRVPHSLLFPPAVCAPALVAQWKTKWLPHRAQVTLLHLPYVLYERSMRIYDLLFDEMGRSIETTVQQIMNDRYDTLSQVQKKYHESAETYFAHSVSRAAWSEIFRNGGYDDASTWWMRLKAEKRYKTIQGCNNTDAVGRLLLWAESNRAYDATEYERQSFMAPGDTLDTAESMVELNTLQQWYVRTRAASLRAHVSILAPKFDWDGDSDGTMLVPARKRACVSMTNRS